MCGMGQSGMSRKSNPRRKHAAARDMVRARVLAAYDSCWLCGRPVDKSQPHLSPMAPEVDEVIPVSLGGSAIDFANCRLAHRWCNQKRGNRSPEAFRAWLAGQQTVTSVQPVHDDI